MVVEQEMAEIYPPSSEDLAEFLPETDCGDCGFSSCIEFASAVHGRGTTVFLEILENVFSAVSETKKNQIVHNNPFCLAENINFSISIRNGFVNGISSGVLIACALIAAS